MYICVTHVDSKTKVICTQEPMRTGPSFPDIQGLNLDWADKSNWPLSLDSSGVYLSAPKYYGTCADDADTNVVGFIESLTEQDYNQRKRDEFYARQPYDSWVFDENTLIWSSPVPYPTDGEDYIWHEETTSWYPDDGNDYVWNEATQSWDENS